MVANDDQTKIVFRPNRKIILLVTLFAVVVALLNIFLVGMEEPATFFLVIKVPGWAWIGLSLAVVVGCLYTLVWSYLPGTETILDLSGMTLHGHGHVTWDEIDKVELYEIALFGWAGMVRLTLLDKRRLYVQWYQIGCKLKRFYQTLRQFVTDIEQGDGLAHPAAEPLEGAARPPVGAYSTWPAASWPETKDSRA